MTAHLPGSQPGSVEHIQTSSELTDSEPTAVLGGTAMELLARVARLRSQTQPAAR